MRHFSGEGGGGVYFEAPRGRNFIRPPFYTPPTPRRVFSGVGGWACIKFGPVFLPPFLATPLPPLLSALVRPFLPLEKCSILQNNVHSTELGEGQVQNGNEIPSRNLREKRSETASTLICFSLLFFENP